MTEWQGDIIIGMLFLIIASNSKELKVFKVMCFGTMVWFAAGAINLILSFPHLNGKHIRSNSGIEVMRNDQ